MAVCEIEGKTAMKLMLPRAALKRFTAVSFL